MFVKNYLAINRNKDILNKSSSGGVFYELAKWVLDRHGVVFGAAWNSEWTVDMISVDSLEALPKIMTSKYVEASIKDTFRECRDFLDQGRIVLYSGTPCQIHALKLYLKKDYDNLYCVDVCCHGIMPLKIWKDYLNLLKRSSPIVSINMRDKKKGWRDYGLRVEYADGYVFWESHKYNIYYKIFLSDAYLRKSCYSCPFKNQKSKADFILGDYWNVNNFDKKVDAFKGVSALVVVTLKGATLLNKIAGKFQLKSSPFEMMQKHNGGFYNSIDTKKIKEYSPSIFDNKNKVGILTLPLHYNVGGILQAYALQTYLNQLGLNATTISAEKEHDPFIDKYLKIKYVKDTKSYSAVGADTFETIVVGSDQIWRPKYAKNIKASFLDFAQNWRVKKWVYSASFGSDKWEYNQEDTETCKKLIKQFKNVSVRELGAQALCQKYLDRVVEYTVDPTMLMSKDFYEDLVKGCPKTDIEVGVYLLDSTPEIREEVKNKLKGYKCVFLDKKCGVTKWLSTFRDCKYVITDSFHGCVFSLIFDRPFMCLINKERGEGRFNSLKEAFDLSERFVYEAKSLNTNILIKEIDKKSLTKIEKAIEDSKKYIDKCLNN